LIARGTTKIHGDRLVDSLDLAIRLSMKSHAQAKLYADHLEEVTGSRLLTTEMGNRVTEQCHRRNHEQPWQPWGTRVTKSDEVGVLGEAIDHSNIFFDKLILSIV
jgi:hypothetical protein